MKKYFLFTMLLCASTTFAQFRSTNDWLTDNGNAQRTATIKGDAQINKDLVAQPGYLKFLWKLKLSKTPTRLSTPATLELLIGYRGFRMMAFVAGGNNQLYTIDTDLGRLEWEKTLKAAPVNASGVCSGGTSTSVVRPTESAIATGGGGFGFGRSTPAVSSVGEPKAGATTIRAATGVGFEIPTTPPPVKSDKPTKPPMGGVFFGGANVIYALGRDGMIHAMHLSNGADYHAPVQFLPAGANANGLIVVDGMAYAVTTNGCGGAANGLWQLDFETQKVSTWKGNIVGAAGAAFGPDGTIYVATSEGALTAIDAKTLQTKATYSATGGMASTPVVFKHGSKTLIAAAAKDGSLHLLDAANLSAALATTARTNPSIATTALASYQDANGTRWILVAHNGALPAGFAGNAATNGAILAWKVVEANGKLVLQKGWASRNVASPLTSTVINGVVFATSSAANRSVIYALDGTTGKELWNSGATITSSARGNALSGGMGQFYLTTQDGTLYAFGVPMER
ncbi:MAG: hypothetical protein HOP19_15980 [Acidobacteria bacterium]|nr:hypothetical protein [Acidobacteriota bacterium]